jgi:hypothetical protein
MNRGIAHRAAFEDRRCIRMFLSLVARAVRAGCIEVHAFSIMTTHYHLLVRSLDGRISATMQRIQNEYVRWFNSTHGRDGPLFRGRFHSRHVTSEIYLRVLVRYIDDNACSAGLVTFPGLYPHSSAHLYEHRRGPRWLTRTFVEELVCELTRRRFSSSGYCEVFGRRITPEASAHMARTIESNADPQCGLDALSASTPACVLAWLRERAKAADGAASAGALCIPSRLAEAITRTNSATTGGDVGQKEIHAALLVQICGLSQKEVSNALAESRWFVSRACQLHRARLAASREYAGLCSHIVHGALMTGHVGVALGLAARFE